MELPSTNKSVARSSDKNDKAKNNNSTADYDPLSGAADPLSGSLASDPLTAALIDPLATSPAPPSGIFDVVKVSVML